MGDDPQQPIVAKDPPNPNKALSDNVQGDILFDGIAKFYETFFFFKIADAPGFCSALKKLTTDHIDSASDTFAKRQQIKASGGKTVDMASANIAFSMKGLQKVRVVDASCLQSFADQITATARRSIEASKQSWQPGHGT